ncbi:MAG: sigma-70 family RNA polymerase sigma factor [Bacteroidaceae bacterium]|nr:sigma-70 family RNA polymerase sigma factor [Bacteroidaceae bacterium]
MRHTDQQIINGLLAGEDWAYGEVFDLYYESMCVLANSILQDSFLAEATAQDVISHIFEVREEISIRTNLRSYLLTSIRNTCLNTMSSKVSRSEQTFSSISTDDTCGCFDGVDATTPQGLMLDNELHKLMNDFIDDLPEPTRTTFIRSRFDGKSYREIGAEQGVSANTVKFRIKNVLKLLEERFGGYLSDS